MKSSFRNLLYFFSLSPALFVIYGNLSGGLFTLSNLVFTLVFWAIVDWVLPSLKSNEHSGSNDTIPNIVLTLHLPFQIASISSLFYGIQTGIIDHQYILFATLSTGLNSGASAIVVSHELIHRKNKLEKLMGKFLLFSAGNIYFFIEHLSIHHRWVGTAKDHASAHYNESLYHFFIRSVSGQIKSAFNVEAKRLSSQNFKKYSLKNYVLRQVVLQFLFLLAILLFLHWIIALCWLLQCFFANFLLEYVNYIQHYGLERNEKEQVHASHSWDSHKFASRFVLVDLARHADHHQHTYKPFHTLEFIDHSPKLPSGYSGLFFIAAIPPLWRKLIHPVLLAKE